MPYVLYNENNLTDEINIFAHINIYTTKLVTENVRIDQDVISRIVKAYKHDFPHNGGIDKASAFKQVANFVCWFVAERPLPEPFPKEIIGEPLFKIINHQNAMVAFDLAEMALNNSTIEKENEILTIKNNIQYSKHSYIDIIDALSTITPSTHFRLLTVFFEQLVYKTNPKCQYDIIN